MTLKKIVVGSRGSKLALLQAREICNRIKELYPDIEVSICEIVTGGDRDSRTLLSHLEGIGFFVKELEEALRDGRVDLAVHSLKDMPTELPEGLCLTAVTERLDPRDVLVTRGKHLDELPPGAKIGTGSLRRSVQLARFRPDLEVCSIRGNVDTRLRRVADGDVDGIILAAAALKRLGAESRITEYLPTGDFIPAVGQGALAIEIRANDIELRGLLDSLNHPPTWKAVLAERAFLKELGGGCRAPIAALGTVDDNILKLEGMAADPAGQRMLRDVEEGDADTPVEIGEQLAKRLLAAGADEFIAEVRRG